MLSGLFGLKGFAIGVVIASVIAFSTGVWVRDSFCDAAAAKLELAKANAIITALRDWQETANRAHEAHVARIQEDAKAELANQERINDTPKNGSACLGIDVVRRLRETK